MIDSKRLVKRFSLQAAAILATVGAITFAEPALANEATSPATNIAENNTETTETQDLSDQLTAVTILENKQQGLVFHVEQATENLSLATEGLEKARVDLETVYSTDTATDEDKAVAEVLYQYHLAFYETTAELKDRFQLTLEEIETALAEMVSEKAALETSREAMDEATQLELYRLERQVIEDLIAEEETAYNALQDLAEEAKLAYETATSDTHTFEEFKALAQAYGRAEALASIAKLTSDYTDIDAKIKELEDILAQDTDNDSDVIDDEGTADADSNTDEEVVSPQLSPNHKNTLLQLIDRSLLSPRIPVIVPVDELLDKLAATTSKEEAEALIKAYEGLAAITGTQSKLDQIYEGLKKNYDVAKVAYEVNKATVVDAAELLVNEVTYQMLSTYTNGVGMVKGNYPYLVQPTVNEATALISGSQSGVFLELPKEKQLELLQLVHQVLSNGISQISRSISPSMLDQRIRFEELLDDASVTEEEFLKQATRYAGSEAFFSPVYAYDFTDLDNRIATLTKPQSNDETLGTSNQEEQNPNQDQSDKADKTDKTNQTDKSDKVSQTDDTTKTGGVNKPLTALSETLPASQSIGTRQTKSLPDTGEGRSAMLSALGLLSVVASVGLMIKKGQD